jgi:hypothetical protein
MRKMSTGDDATLGNYRKMCALFFGEDSKATSYLDEKISRSLIGEGEEIIANEGQIIQLLMQIDFQGKK